MDALPEEILLLFAKFAITTADLTRLAAVCSRLRRIILEDDTIWRDLHLRIYGSPIHKEYAKYGKTWRWLCLARRTPVKCRLITPANVELGSRGGRYYGDVCSNAGFLIPHGYGYWHVNGDEGTLEGEWKRGAMHGAMKASILSGRATVTAQMVSNQPIESTIQAQRRMPPDDGEEWVKVPAQMCAAWFDGPHNCWVPLFPSTD